MKLLTQVYTPLSLEVLILIGIIGHYWLGLPAPIDPIQPLKRLLAALSQPRLSAQENRLSYQKQGLSVSLN